ncbi:MAG: hypothetical protein LBI39_00790 [Puniceicoccales bacterium]|nr:hypothetical protein [Puniceicoccales bacterium]
MANAAAATHSIIRNRTDSMRSELSAKFGEEPTHSYMSVWTICPLPFFAVHLVTYCAERTNPDRRFEGAFAVIALLSIPIPYWPYAHLACTLRPLHQVNAPTNPPW